MKETDDIAPIIAKTLMGRRSSDAHFQQLVESISVLHKDSYVKTIEASTYYDRSPDLERTTWPTLLVYGGDDRLNSIALGRKFARKLKVRNSSEFQMPVISVTLKPQRNLTLRSCGS